MFVTRFVHLLVLPCSSSSYLELFMMCMCVCVYMSVVVSVSWNLIFLFHRVKEEHPIMALSLSKDARYALLNVASQVCVIVMYNID